MIKKLIRYFDLQSKDRPTRPHVSGDAGPTFPVIPQYAALVLGIAVQPFLSQFQETGKWGQPTDWLHWLPFAVIVGIVVFPAVYKNTVDPSKALFVQLCAIFAGGIGWQSLFKSAVKGAQAALGGQ